MGFKEMKKKKKKKKKKKRAGRERRADRGQQQQQQRNSSSKWQGSSVNAHRVRVFVGATSLSCHLLQTNNIYQQPHHLLALLLQMAYFWQNEASELCGCIDNNNDFFSRTKDKFRV